MWARELRPNSAVERGLAEGRAACFDRSDPCLHFGRRMIHRVTTRTSGARNTASMNNKVRMVCGYGSRPVSSQSTPWSHSPPRLVAHCTTRSPVTLPKTLAMSGPPDRYLAYIPMLPPLEYTLSQSFQNQPFCLLQPAPSHTTLYSIIRSQP
jgi:hypothetical protein